MFFSTLEPICLTPDSCLQRKGVPMLYERAAKEVQTLYVCPLENVLGQVPLIQCYLNGNTANTIQHKYRSRIPREAAADSRPNSGTGCRLFDSEVNVWMWRYGRTFPREITVAQAVELQKKRVQESRARGAETVRCMKEAALAASEFELNRIESTRVGVGVGDWGEGWRDQSVPPRRGCRLQRWGRQPGPPVRRGVTAGVSGNSA